MRQKVTIARGLVLDRAIVFYDEPSVSLDVPSARALRELITADSAAHGRTALIASHTADDIAICHRTALLSQGHLLGLGTPAELRAPLDHTRLIEVVCAHADPTPAGLGTLPGLMGVRRTPDEAGPGTDRLALTVDPARFALDALIDTLLADGVHLVAIDTREWSIEQVYDAYVATGGDHGVA